MAGASQWLSQYQALKSSSESLIVAIEDLNDLWPQLKEAFEARLPLKKPLLFNKAHNSVVIEKLPLEFVLTTDPRLRSRTEQSPFIFRLPYATILMVACEDVDDYKTILKPRIKLLVQNEEREYFIVFVIKSNPAEPAGKQARKVYNKLESDFSGGKKRERCCKLELNSAAPVSWEEIETRLGDCIRNTLERRIQSYDEEFKRLDENRFLLGWSFTMMFITKEGLAFMFELACLYDDALREYEELEQLYLEIVNIPSTKLRDFGGTDPGDDRAALLDVSRKQVIQFVADDYFREFDFRQYLFAKQAALLFKLNRPTEVAGRGLAFTLSFSKFLLHHQKNMPFCLREVWVITACLSLIEETGQRFAPRLVTPDAEREFYRLQADLSSLARAKLMRLADLIGYGPLLHRSPCNSALLSMAPWPKPSVWPAVPPDAAARILAKEQVLEGSKVPLHSSGSHLQLSPTMLLREANRRRASLSGGNVSEILESRLSFKESPGVESPSSIQRSFSSTSRPTSPSSSSSLTSPSRAGFDMPMKLAEIHAAAEHEILKLVSHDGLRKALTSLESFEEMYFELTRSAADNYHRSRKRHGVVLDGEVAAVHHRTGNFDSAAKLYEKVCALYSGERWDALLAEVLPRLAECQKQLDDRSGYLSSCVKLLSLNRGLLSTDQRKTLQAEVVMLAHSGLTVPVPVDVSALITFCGQPGPPLELCEGDPGTLTVTVWSGFVDEISLESLSLTLSVAYSNDEGGKAIKGAENQVLRPGKNSIVMLSQPQRPGSYVLNALTGQIGQVKLRSHANCTISAIGSPENDDFLSSERPLRPVLQVSVSRPLVEVKPAVSGGLLVGEPQWIGLLIQPLEYSLSGAILHVTTLPGLSIYEPQLCQLQLYNKVAWALVRNGSKEEKSKMENGIIAPERNDILELKSGSIELPAWASHTVSILWLQVVAKRQLDNQTADIDSSMESDSIRKPEEIARSLNVKLEFGVARSRVYEKAITVFFTEAFRITTRLVAKGNDGTFLLQVTLISQVNARITILDADLSLQDGLLHAGNREGRPDPSWLFPMVISGNAECALLFVVKSDNTLEQNTSDLPNGDYEKKPSKSVLNVRYRVAGSRTSGAHPPSFSHGEEEKEQSVLLFQNAFKLQMPVLDSLVAVGMLPVPVPCPTVGQQVILQWRIQRLKTGRALEVVDAASSLPEVEELAYEIKSSESWMIAGRRKGHLSLPTKAEAQLVVSVACVPLVAGHVHPPWLDLCDVNHRHISHNPPGPHLVCIYPGAPCYAFCLAKDSSIS